MSLHAEMTEEEFTEEMTHRVVKYGARSPESREALRFSKKHPNSKLQKIARFKVSEQERFDIENGLASPWVRVLHFLDEEVFDRLRLGSIGQVVSVTGLVLSILFLSDRTRSWFGNAPTTASQGIRDEQLLVKAMESPSPADEWLNRKLIEAINSQPVQDALSRSLQQSPTNTLAPVLIATLKSSIAKDGSLKMPLAVESDEELLTRLRSTLAGSRLSDDGKAKVQQWLDNPEDRAALLGLIRADMESESVQSKAKAAMSAWLDSPVAQAALESLQEPPKKSASSATANQ